MTRVSSKTSAAGLSVLSNTSLITLKLVVGIATHSISIVAEAIHSVVDLVAALIAYFAVRKSGEPPDEAHAFGHGKFENISGTVEALLIIGAAIFIGWKSIHRFADPEVLRPGIGAIVMLISVVANWLVSSRLFKVAEDTDSIALEADAQHLRLDVYTSGIVLLGLSVMSFIPGASIIDPILGLTIALWLTWIGLQLSWKAMGPLLDLQLPSSEVERISSIIHEDDRVVGFHKLRTRKSGAERHVDVHIVVSPEMSLEEAHIIAEDIEDKIREEFENVFVLTHIEPSGKCPSAPEPT